MMSGIYTIRAAHACRQASITVSHVSWQCVAGTGHRCSRSYSVTFGQLRAARTEYRRAARAPDADRDAWGRSLDEAVVLVLPVIWTYEGTGCPIAADAELALAAAARAREHCC